MPDISHLRRLLVSHSLFPQTTLKRAVDRLGFVQADPIRSPARCQDLILRHRVKNYKAGDLERRYPLLDLDEDFTFAYGFLQRKNRNMLHPRSGYTLNRFERTVVEAVEECGPSKSTDLEAQCGSRRVRNAWGGRSKATKKALENAHHYGYLRVAHRDNGIRVYDSAPRVKDPLSPATRFEQLLLITANLFGPTQPRFLLSELRYSDLVDSPQERRKILQGLIDRGLLIVSQVDGVEYVFTKPVKSRATAKDKVRLLAPFDPVVRDRERFERLWGWSYRFEAYTPAAKRVRGYYAMPILWRDDVVGWANANVEGEKLTLEIGYEREPEDLRSYRSALETEVSDLATFLHLQPDAWRMVKHPRSQV